MSTKTIKNVFKSNCSNTFNAVNHNEESPSEIIRDSTTKLFPGEFPYCGKCILYSEPGVCPIANVLVDNTSDGTGCVLRGVYQKKHITQESAM